MNPQNTPINNPGGSEPKNLVIAITPEASTFCEFTEWMENELDALVERYSEWQTTSSNRKYFER